MTSTRTGCVCLMYIKEGDENDPNGAVYRPFWATSGIAPYQLKGKQKTEDEMEQDSYRIMGLPVPKSDNTSRVLTKEQLEKHLKQQEKLGIKQPNMQSKLYFLQTPEFNYNKSQNFQSQEEYLNDEPVGPLESWRPSNCAEPGIMAVIYQLDDQPKDIDVSIPFEGELSKDGSFQLKYTCKRCALAEPAFLAPVKLSDDPPNGIQMRPMDMRVESDKPRPKSSVEWTDLVVNSDKTHSVYRGREKTMWAHQYQNQLEGFYHEKNPHSDKKKSPPIEELGKIESNLQNRVNKLGQMESDLQGTKDQTEVSDDSNGSKD